MLIDSLANKTGDTLVVICYHVIGSYSNPIAEERESYYGTGLSVPFVVFDGFYVVWEENPDNYYNAYRQGYELARRKTPYYNLSIDSAYTEPSRGFFNLKIVTADTIPEGEIKAFIAITEDSLQGAFTTYYRVCRSLYEIPVELVYPDSIVQHFEFIHNIPASKLRATVFIQNLNTKEVMQATSTKFREAR